MNALRSWPLRLAVGKRSCFEEISKGSGRRAKRVRSDIFPNADLYQLRAYTIATNLPGGMLIYAAGDEEPVKHEVVHVGKRLETIALDLSGTPQIVLNPDIPPHRTDSLGRECPRSPGSRRLNG